MYKNEMKKEIVFFMPSFEGGGVEKNIRMIANFFASKNVKISLITTSKKVRGKFKKNIDFISPKNEYWDKQKKIYKVHNLYFFSISKLQKKKQKYQCLLFSK